MISLIQIEEILNNGGEMPAGGSEFSILMPFAEKNGELLMLFEVRAMNLRRQPGEVCFPGGRIEAGESTVECAVRETSEELGIAPERVRIIGCLGSLLSLLNEKINLFVGEITDYENRGINPNPGEVHKVFEVPFDFFTEHGIGDAFNFDGNYIWGLTARAVNKMIKISGRD